MSRILVVAQRNLLRQAMGLALFPDHEVQFAASFSDSNAAIAKEFDLVIMDSEAFRATDKSSGELLRKVRGWKVPTIWIDDIGAGQAAGHDRRIVLTSPLQRETLKSAIAECLDRPTSKEQGTANMRPRERIATKEARIATASRAAGPQIIELVDVVAEPPSAGKSNTPQSKTK